MMKDVQNSRGDYKFEIDRVGVSNLLHPLRIESKEGKVWSVVGNFSLGVNLARDLKGVNMSRLPQLLAELEEEGFVLRDCKSDIKQILKLIAEKMESEKSFLSCEFDFFMEKKAPVSAYSGLNPYKVKVEGELKGAEYDFTLTVEVPITTLCPCSKEISSYSAHNQRGYVSVSIKHNEVFYIEDLIRVVEGVGSCEIYPILKREDEKYVTEKAYENPHFVEDVVRLVAGELSADERVEWFRVSSRHQESIHSHDAYAELSSGNRLQETGNSEI